MGGRVATRADHIRAIRVTRHRRAQQDIKGKGHGEVLRVREGKERLMWESGVSIRQATPEAKGATRYTAIKQAGTAGRCGVIRMVEREECTGCYHCRSCPLGVWVASNIQAIQIKQTRGSVSIRVIKAGSSDRIATDSDR